MKRLGALGAALAVLIFAPAAFAHCRAVTRVTVPRHHTHRRRTHRHHRRLHVTHVVVCPAPGSPGASSWPAPAPHTTVAPPVPAAEEGATVAAEEGATVEWPERPLTEDELARLVEEVEDAPPGTFPEGEGVVEPEGAPDPIPPGLD